MYGAAVGAVQGSGAYMGGQGCKFALRAAGDFGVAAVISADKPEDEFFVTGINEEGNTEVSTAVHGIVEFIKAQDSSLFVSVVDIVQLHHITGLLRVADKGFAFTGLC
ncbi:hypothetical protein [Salmonella enterica]|uniref:hypothetical protein n=1 Tax=Salmonella enterica TaxID=28901 RepID=UPI0012B68370|nr:hypothetical protein [Salmonella enterica]EDB4569333.1 hypothetical protein [Salmonella enterica subsp. enterica serovar Panama]EFP6323340.1 hypothetical protein [Salmonella enterica]